jgi:hypothetical protein
MTQVVEHLPSKCEILNSIPSTTPEKRERERERKENEERKKL